MNIITGHLIRDKLMSGKLLIEWRHDICNEITMERYAKERDTLTVNHIEIVNLFFPQDVDESDDGHSDASDKSSKVFFSLFYYSVLLLYACDTFLYFSYSFLYCMRIMKANENGTLLLLGK